MKLLIAKMLVATSCVAGGVCPPNECVNRWVPGHWQEMKGQVFSHNKWSNARIRVWIPGANQKVCSIV